MQEKTSGKFIERIGKDKIRIGGNLFKIKDWNSMGSNTISLVSDSSENFADCLKKFQDINIGSLVSELDREIKGAFKISFDHTLTLEEVVLMEQFPLIAGKAMSYIFLQNVESWNLPFSFVEFFEELLIKLKNENKFIIGNLEDYIKPEKNNLYLRRDFGIIINPQEVRALNLYQLENIIINGVKETMKNLKEKYMQTKNELKIPIEDLEYRFILKQYLMSFSEFVRKATGKIIYFEVETAIDGLVIKIDKNENFENYRENLAMYLSFKENGTPDLNILRQLGLDSEQISTVILFLTTQIVAYQRQYERLVESNKLLEGKNEELSKTVQMLDRLFSKNIECNQNNQKIEVTNNNYLENKNSVDINIQVTQNIEKLQENMCDLKRLLTPILDEHSKEELKEIVNELVNIKTEDELKKNKGILVKTKSYLKYIPQIISSATIATTAIRENLDKIPIIRENILAIIDLLSNYI